MMKKQDSYRPILILLAILFLLLVVFPGPIQAYTLVWEVTSDPSSFEDDEAYSITSDANFIYISGLDRNTSNGNAQFRVEKRRKSDGGEEWVQTINPSDRNEGKCYIASDAGYVYICGRVEYAFLDTVWHIEKLNKSNGTNVWTKTLPYDNFPRSITVDNQSVYIAGYDRGGLSGPLRWHIQKLNKSTGAEGWNKISNPSPTEDDSAQSITCDDDYIYISGHSHDEGCRIEKRQKSDGIEIWGETTASGGTFYCITVDANYIYTAGSRYYRTEKRLKSTGALEWEQTILSNSTAFSITCDDDYIYTAGWDGAGAGVDAQWRIQKRLKSTGALEWEQTSDPSPNDDQAYSITCDDEFIYIAGLDRNTSNGKAQWRIEKRKKVGYVDIGLRVYDQDVAEPIKIAAEPQGTLTSPLRIAKNGFVWGIVLIDSTDPKFGDPQYDSGVRIRTGSGDIKALRKYE